MRPPKSLLIIGGDDTGVEIAQLMSIFGTKVYIVEKADNLLPRYDSEAGEMIGRILKEQKGVTSLTHSKVVSVQKDGLLKKVIVSQAGTDKSIKVDEILIADGRAPSLDIGLENAGVKYTNGGIQVNDHLQTNVKHIFAAGEVLGRGSHTHTALIESHIAENNIFKRNKASVDYTATSEVVFTNPGVAITGWSEQECKKRGIAINKAVAPLSIIARSNTSDFRDGLVKIITDKKGIIVGASVVAPHAAEIIHELSLAVKCKLTAADVASTPHAFLSWSEAVRVAASKLA